MKQIVGIVLCCLLTCLVMSSCSKKIDTSSVEDFSIQQDINLNKIIQVNQTRWVIGGEKFTKSYVGRFQQNQLNAVSLPPDGLQTEIYDMATNEEGKMVCVTNSAGLFLSSDTGNSWHFVQSPIWREMKGVLFYSTDSMLIAGKGSSNYGYLAKGNSEALGLHVEQNTYKFELNDIERTPNGALYACGYGAVLKSEDAGSTWRFLDAKNDWFRSMYWKDNQEGYVLGYEGSIVKTMDAGLHWEFLRNGNNSFFKRYHLAAISGNESLVVVVGESGLVLVSRDAGSHWKTVRSFTKQNLHGIFMEGENQFMVCGAQGSLFRITLAD